MSSRLYGSVFALLFSSELMALARPGLPSWTIGYALDLGEAVDCGKSHDWTHNAADAEIVVQAQKEITVRGRDLFGRAWRVQAGYPGDGGCRLFVHDLDKNAARDLIFLTANSGSGPAGLTMTIIAFDRARRPIPWQATGPFFVESNRVQNITDMDGDQRAELLFQHTEEVGTRRETGVSTALYRITDGYFSRTTGRFAGRKFPIRQPTKVQFVDEPDLGSAVLPDGPSVKMRALKERQNGPCWLKGIAVTAEGITLASKSPAAEECSGYVESVAGNRVRTPLIAIIDLPKEGRVVDINYSLDVVSQAVRLEMPVVLAGRSCETGCRPFIMWARPL